jgi:rhamnose utilization protein RhaD (predicted bifunctional aldolase and dehydrogenase)
MEKTMLRDLVDISRYYGANSEYVIAGGGNTSFKNASHIWVKASGISLETIDENGFVCLSREKLKVIEEKEYSKENVLREQEVKNDLSAAITDSALRPSVETSLHDIIDYAYVVHTHPTKLNGLLCSNSAKNLTLKLFGSQALFIEYTDPGYILFKKVLQEINQFKGEYNVCPKLIFLENHGVFVAADSVNEIKELYQQIMEKVEPPIELNDEFSSLKNDKLQKISNLPELQEKSVLAFTGELIRDFITEEKSFSKINTPFTPDHIVYCKSKYLYLESSEDLTILSEAIRNFHDQHGYDPKVIAIGDYGLVTVEESENSANTVFEVYYDMMKISRLSESYGGPKFMTPGQIEFIDNWEVENYRRKVAAN